MKQRVKHFLGMAAYRSGVYRKLLRGKALVVLFHRVNDWAVDDPLACSSDKFRAFCEFFSKYFRVVSLGTLVGKLEAGEDITGLLVVTFDDGYKDNHDVAAVELRRQHLPGCFFVTTGFVASRRVPWWNQGDSTPPEWMTWEDVRSLVEQGFEVGAHTVNHVDLGVVSGEEAVCEIVGSKEHLARETSTRAELFSYPYGGPDQMTEQNREVVRGAGFRCCLSAWGGAVSGTSDPFAIRRVAVSPWHISPYHFGFEALFLPS